MRSSRLGLVALLTLLGCTRGVATPPATTVTAPMSSASGASRIQTPGQPVAGTSSRAAAGSPTPAAAVTAGALDPSETITPNELASIPDPVPGRVANSGDAPQRAPGAAPAAIAQPSGGEPKAPQSGSGAVSGAGVREGNHSVWRVQVFASPDLSQASRVANEAAGHFGISALIEFEDPLYKVRLGAFSSEAEAQALRERAVSEGYPGAFRMKSTESTNESNR